MSSDPAQDVDEASVLEAKNEITALTLRLRRLTREADELEWQLDEVPSSLEVHQYKKRYRELDNQVCLLFRNHHLTH